MLKKSSENEKKKLENDKLTDHFQSLFIYFFSPPPPDPKSENNSRKSTNKKILA